MDPLDIRVELYHSGGWEDITADSLSRQDIAITRGRRDESSQADPSRCQLQINNATGRYTPRNPRSDLYGLIGRNTPLRVRVGQHSSHPRFGGDLTAHISTPDTASELAPTGVVDIRVDLEPDTWHPAEETLIGGKGGNPGQDSWDLLLEHGQVRIKLRTANGDLLWSDRAVSQDAPRRRAVRMVYHPVGSDALDPGSVGHPTIEWYTADTLDDPWTRIAVEWWDGYSEVDMLSTDWPVVIGALDGDPADISQPQYRGLVHGLQVADGAGTLLADVRLSNIAEDAPTSITGGTGRVWTATDTVTWEDTSVRGAGEVAAWPQRWDVSGRDVWVPITASGLLRRLGQGSSPLRSALRRASTHPSEAHRTIAYWPMEDGDGATTLASGIGNPPAMINFTSTLDYDVDVAAYSDFLGSDAVPELHVSSITGTVPRAEPTGEVRIFWVQHIPAGGVAGIRTLMTCKTTGTAAEWGVEVDDRGYRRVRAWDIDGTSLLTSTYVTSDLTGRPVLIGLWLQQNGADVDWQSFFFDEGESTALVYDGTLAGHTFGAVTSVTLGGGGDLAGTAVGHLSVHNRDTDSLWTGIVAGWNAHVGEPAGDRIVRLCAEEQVPLRVIGDPAVTTELGPQERDTLLGLLRQAAEADLGLLGEQRDAVALSYRTRTSLYNQVPLELDYAQRHISAPFEPTPDDQTLRNDVTVSRRGGSSYRAVAETGPLSIQPPPDGVGRYDTSVDLSLERDAQTENLARWRLHLGTLDVDRYPKVGVDLARNPQLSDALSALDLGDRVTIDNPPEWMPPGMVDLIAQGVTETLNTFRRKLVLNTTPGEAWRVVIADVHRAVTVHSEVVADVAAGTDTSFDLVSGRFEGYESSDLLVQHTDGGDAPWTRDDTTANSGTWSLRSGTITHGQTSDASVTVPAWAHWLQLAVRTSSEWGWDHLHILLDDEVIYERDGDQAWTTTDWLSVVGGSTVTFRYTKDGSTSSFEDAVWIDDVAFVADDGWTIDPNQFPQDVLVSGVRLRVTSIDYDNALTNPHFEAGLSPWQAGNATVARTDTRAHGGTWSAEITPDGTSERGWINSESITVSPGDRVVHAAWLWSTDATDSASVSIEWLDSTGAYIATSEELEALPAGAWTRLAREYTAPPGAASAQAVPTLAGTPPASQVWHVDDVTLAIVTPVQTATVEQAPVNGVTKTIPRGASVQIADPAVLAP